MTERIKTPFGFSSTTDEVLAGVHLNGKRAIVTGGYAGLGYETARALAGAGASVTIAGRKPSAVDSAVTKIIAATGNPTVDGLVLDLADLDSVATATAEWAGPLDILINNAGVMAIPKLTPSRQGHELQFAVNFLGHFALTVGLRDALAAAPDARIVNLSSNAHLYSPPVFGDLDYNFRGYHPLAAYAEAKAAMVLFAVEADRRWAADGIRANACNPGAIATGLQQHTGGLQTPVERRKTVEQGAATSVLLAASPLLNDIGGRYFEDVAEAEVRHRAPGGFGTGVAAFALDHRYSELLFELALELIN
ncbi:SDR family NAD(P)-dependent oxidoreductase [Microlunatus soli]|uniref:NAD(P)-dependent dehydrogenase, short-chain alcohol dehydrogenase family n=1 Tax=Microlunatus soli TaxID=630515 RepID=A0A1H1UIX5_9ACTN|nr:SDR family NAD(P)-dependent oxidoreductase [Microlunatus soli]SDS71809.1 NAD(P)-dependent dehydrogenase, short-chain alcohol dehydrogenase family [Microlunatus soli]